MRELAVSTRHLASICLINMKGISIDIIFIDVVSLGNAESATKHPLIDSIEQFNGYFKIPHLAITQSDVLEYR